MSKCTIIRAVAGADLSSDTGLFVGVNGASDDERVVRITAGTSVLTLGVLINAPADDAVAEIAYEGIVTCKAGGAIEPYDYVSVEDTTGRAQAAVTSDAIVGQFLPLLDEADPGSSGSRDAADGDTITIYLFADKQNLSA